MFANQHKSPELKQDIINRGQEALREALGFDGAMQFLQHISAQTEAPAESDGTKGVAVMIKARSVDEVAVVFSKTTKWLRFTPAEADVFASKIREIAEQARRKR